MIYFSPTVQALQAHIAELQARLAASEAERQSLLDRLLLKHNFSPIAEPEATPASSKPALQVIAPPGVNPVEIQDAVRDVWIREEADYLIGTLGYDELRAYNQAAQSYNDQHGIS